MKVDIKNRRYYYLATLVNINDLNFENIKFDKKLYEDILFTKLNMKHHMVQNFCMLFFQK